MFVFHVFQYILIVYIFVISLIVTRSMYGAFRKLKFPNPMQTAEHISSVFVRIDVCPELEAKLALLAPRKVPKRRHS